MALTWSWDTIENNRVRFGGRHGYEIIRQGIASGITGDPTEQALLAMFENETAVPKYGDPHPELDFVWCNEIEAEIVGPGVAKVTFIYTSDYPFATDPDYIQVDEGSTLTSFETCRDITGADMTVTHEGKDQTVLVSKLVPTRTVSFTLLENANPGPKSELYVGKVNSVEWTYDPGSTARQWMCTGITGHSEDGGVTYRVTYSFEKHPWTWDTTQAYIDPITGRAPATLDTDNYKTFVMYSTVNFNLLGF